MSRCVALLAPAMFALAGCGAGDGADVAADATATDAETTDAETIDPGSNDSEAADAADAAQLDGDQDSAASAADTNLKGCPANAPCDDGDPCTFGDHCVAGACAKGLDLCVCRDDADCAIGADLCAGKRYCDKTEPPYACKLLPGTAIACDLSLDTACSQTVCDATTASCKPKAALDGTLCNDGNPCSVGDACAAGSCVAGGYSACACQSDADCKDDNDACNGKPFCDKGLFPFVCKPNPATIPVCAPSADPCQVSACAAASGACVTKAAPDLTPCDDGKSATVGDACIAGVCSGSELGFCAADKDCAVVEDGNVCNGSLYCNKASKTCEVNPATVITCPKAADTACLQAQCVPVTGQCLLVPVKEGKACDDGDACTVGDHCVGGACAPSADTCQCSNDAECGAYDDKNACNGKQFCNLGLAKPRCQDNPAAVIVCPTADDTTCSKNACVPLSGACTLTATEDTKSICDPQTGVCRREQRAPGDVGPKASCDDGNGCTVGDTCQQGACLKGTDVCICQSDADCADKTDGDLCKGPWYCDKSASVCKPNPAKAVVCPSATDTACVQSKCNPATGQCKPTLLTAGTPCDDGEPCTEGTLCLEGQCKAGAITCECIVHSDCEQKLGDGNLCNGVFYCDKSGLKPKCVLNPQSVVECPPNLGTLCLKNSCNPATGFCSPSAHNQGKACDDGNVCSVGDACDGGLCVGKVNACDDQDACTADACVSGQGCVHSSKLCDDGNECTVDSCIGLTGQCAHNGNVTSGKLCDADGTPCTQGDACDQGACKAGVVVQCPKPKDPCSKALCIGVSASESKCVDVPQADGVGCDDAASCTVGNVCKVGVCVAGDKGKLWEVTNGPTKIGPNKAFTVRNHTQLPLVRVDGGVSVLVMASNSPTSAFQDRMFAVAYSSTGVAGEETELSNTAHVPTDAARLLSGQFAVVANSNATGTSSAEIRLIDANVSKIAGVSKPPLTNPSFYTVVRVGKELTLGGRANSKPLVIRMTDGLSEVWTWTGDGLSGLGGTVAAAAQETGEVSAVVALRTTGGIPIRGSLEDETLVRLDANGKLLWKLPFSDVSKATGQTATLRLLQRPSGTFLAVGKAKWSGSTGSTMVLELAGPTTGVIGAYLPTKVGWVWNDALIDGAGRVALVGEQGIGNSRRARLQLLGASGKSELIWDSLTDGTNLDHVVLSADQRLVVAGDMPSTFRLQVRDSFGNMTCAAAGACFGVAVVGCDDGDACTADSCDVKVGCEHTKIAGCVP